MCFFIFSKIENLGPLLYIIYRKWLQFFNSIRYVWYFLKIWNLNKQNDLIPKYTFWLIAQLEKINFDYVVAI